jgi:hypothetical protein
VIITGVNSGTTTLFLRQKNNNGAMLSYLINASYFNEQEIKSRKAIQQQYIYKTSKNSTTGIYSLRATSTFGPENKTQYQIINHFLSYNLPVYDNGTLSFRSSFLNKLSGFNTLENISLPSIELNYFGKDIEAIIGTVNSSNPFLLESNSFIGALSTFRDNLKGLKFSQRTGPLSYSVYTGVQKSDFTFYNREITGSTYNPGNNSIGAGASGEIALPFRNLTVSGVFNSNFETEGKYDKTYNLVGGFNVDPFNNLNLNGSIGSNFSGLGYYLNSTYNYSWDKKNIHENLVRISGTYKNLSRGYLSSKSEAQSDYNIGAFIKHEWGVALSGSYNLSTLSNNVVFNGMNFSIGKGLFNDDLYLFASANMNNYPKQQLKSDHYDFGLNLRAPLPISLNYEYLQNRSVKGSVNQHQVMSSVRLIRNETADLNLSGNYSRNIYVNTTTSAAGVYLNGIYKGINGLNIGGNVGYVFDFGSSVTKSSSGTLLLGTNIAWAINHANQLSVSAGYNNKLSDQSNNYGLNTSLTYTYNFGSSFEEAKGAIRGVAFDDENDNGELDKGEKIIPGIMFNLKENEESSGETGIVFKDLAYGSYDVFLDTQSLPKGYRVTGASPLSVYVAADSIDANFPLSHQGIIKGMLYKNKDHSMGMEGIELSLDNQEKITTSDNGLFSFKTVTGKHTIRIEPKSIPLGYVLTDTLSKEIDLDTVADLDFTFNPVIRLTGHVSNKSGLPASFISLKVKYETDDDTREETIQTDKDGKFVLKGLIAGTVEISSPLMPEPLLVEIPANPQNIKKDIILK